MTTIWLIRHGESEANAGLPTEHPETIPLTALGHKQAQRTSQAFAHAPGLIVTSKYLRARQTAQHTQQRFPDVPVETWDIHEFTYLSPAALGTSTIAERKPLSSAYWEKCNPSAVEGADTESFAGFIERIQTLQKRLLHQDQDFVAIFCHGFVIKALLWSHLLGSFNPTPDYMRGFHLFHRSFDLFNCAIIEMKLDGEKVMVSGLLSNHLRDQA